MVEEIVGFCPELQIEAIVQMYFFPDGNIDLIVTESTKHIAGRVATIEQSTKTGDKQKEAVISHTVNWRLVATLAGHRIGRKRKHFDIILHIRLRSRN
jgi:hypothetical protein